MAMELMRSHGIPYLTSAGAPTKRRQSHLTVSRALSVSQIAARKTLHTPKTIAVWTLYIACSLVCLSNVFLPTVGRLSIAGRSQPVENLVYEVALLGGINTYAYYFLDIFVGSPEFQRQSVILDTGSSLLGFTCAGCSNCGSHIDPPFNTSLSATSSWLACDGECNCAEEGVCSYSVEYEEGSALAGRLFTDVAVLGGKWRNGTGGSKWLTYRETGDSNGNDRSSTMTNTESQSYKNSSRGGTSDTDSQEFLLPTANRILIEDLSGSVVPRSLSSPEIRAKMGCHKEETNLFVSQQVTGIIGLTYRTSPNEPQTIIDSLFTFNSDTNAGIISKDVRYAREGLFAICLAEEGGLMTIGGFYRFSRAPSTNASSTENNVEYSYTASGIVGSLDDSDITWTRLMPHHQNYAVDIISISVGAYWHIPATVPHGAMVDSGTTHTYVERSLWQGLTDVLSGYIKCKECIATEKEDELCWSSEETIPNLYLNFRDGNSVEWLPKNYAFKKDNLWCLTIHSTEENSVTLGMNFFLNRNIIFDLKTDRIGFVSTSCPSHSYRSVTPADGAWSTSHSPRLPPKRQRASQRSVSRDAASTNFETYGYWNIAATTWCLALSVAIIFILCTAKVLYKRRGYGTSRLRVSTLPNEDQALY